MQQQIARYLWLKKSIHWLRENPIKTDQDRLDYEVEDKVIKIYDSVKG
jgi:hypothetical protein